MLGANELVLRGENATLTRLLERLEELLQNGWKRDRAAEARVGPLGLPSPGPTASPARQRPLDLLRPYGFVPGCLGNGTSPTSCRWGNGN
jgi:hypothetical protein